MRSVVVALSGPSGVGKSTTAAGLEQAFGWAHLEEAYCRLVPRPRLTWSTEVGLERLELRLLDEEAQRYREACELAAAGTPVVVDTSFLDPVAYIAGLYRLGLAEGSTMHAVAARARRLAREGRLGVPDLTVYLTVPPEVVRRRAARDPRRHPPALRDRHAAVGRVEATTLVPALRRSVGVRCVRVRADVRPDRLAGRIAARARRTTPLREPERTLLRVLDELLRSLGPRGGPRAAGKVKKGTLSPRPPR